MKKIEFRRITSSGVFVPEIDGLRFFAILSVVLYHIFNFMRQNFWLENFDFQAFAKLFAPGALGVHLFFVISGFILGTPFAKQYLVKNGEKVSLKNFYLRRLSRLEPPYILAMTMCLFGALFIAKNISFDEGIISYVFSIFYLHNIIFPNVAPFLNGPAWSLEIEVQFYILVPLLSLVFKVGQQNIRRLILISSILLLSFFNAFVYIKTYSLLLYFHYFLIGFLLVDFNLMQKPQKKVNYFYKIIGVLLFFGVWFLQTAAVEFGLMRFVTDVFFMISVFGFYYSTLILRNYRFITHPLITNIGGMCYSIYLFHSPIIVAITPIIYKLIHIDSIVVKITLITIILLMIIFFISSIFYLLIERPCMDKNWVKKVLNKINNRVMGGLKKAR